MPFGKVVYVPFEAVRDASEDVEAHGLSGRSQMLALSQTGLLHWPSRWYKQDGSEISDSEIRSIEDWASKTESELLTDVSDTPPSYPTPFWDDVIETDDQAVATEQTWYGSVLDPQVAPGELTFVEDAAIWAFTGFIAYSAGIGAAVFFHTVAPRFVLAFKKSDVGEIIRIVIDSADYASVDTSLSSSDLVEIPVDVGAGEHDILLVRTA